MSTTVFENEKVSFTVFWGGNERRVCVQITLKHDCYDKGYTQMTLEDFLEAVEAVKLDTK